MLTALTSGGRALLNLLQSQLAFFGAIDEAVLYAKEGHGANPDAVLSIVETLLPNTTGFGQAGWYRELEQFANRPGVLNPGLRSITFPSVPAALEYLQAADHEERMRLATASLGEPTPEPTPEATTEPPSRRITEPPTEPTPEPPGGPPAEPPRTPAELAERVGNYDTYHDPVLARATYAAMVLANIANLGGTPPGLSDTPDLPAQIMGAAVNFWAGTPDKFNRGNPTSDPTVRSLLNEAKRVKSRKQWHSFAAKKVSEKFADQSLPCFGTLEADGDQYCSTLYTNATDNDLSVNDIKRIVDPRNWSLCCKFFCTVVAQTPPYAKHGWSRILETIGPECAEWCLHTALLFFYGLDDNGGLFVNYDLDPHRQGDSGMVEVDNGYIWVTPLNGTDPSQKGVRIRTSKQERVQGLSPTATSALGCLLGWGDAANELLSGTAVMVLKGEIPGAKLAPFATTPPNNYTSQMDSGVAQPAGIVASPATLPPNFGNTVDDVRKLLNDLVDRTRDVTADAATRWLDGMSREDVKKITTGIGTNLRQYALEVYHTAESNVKPEVTKGE
jgi:hypothetical protein